MRVNVPAGITFCSKMKSPVIRHGNPHTQVTLSVSTDRKINSTERDFSLIFIRLAHSTSQLDPQILVTLTPTFSETPPNIYPPTLEYLSDLDDSVYWNITRFDNPRMTDLARTFLLPGEGKFSKAPAVISTLLGSCVSVCIYDTKNHFGGMNHFVLPTQDNTNLAPGRYGDFATNTLIKIALNSGSQKSNLVASVYGGGSVVGHLGALNAASMDEIGERNIELARSLLAEHRIRIIREDVGGSQGRKIHMHTDSNEIQMRPIVTSERTTQLANRKRELDKRKARVLLVDDSQTVRRMLTAGIAQADDLEVVGEAENPYEAREQILALDPDVICLDIVMPRMDGHTFLKKIMEYKPIPTVICSTIAREGSAMRDNVMKAGAVDVVDKNELEIYKGPEVIHQVLLPKLRKAATTVF